MYSVQPTALRKTHRTPWAREPMVILRASEWERIQDELEDLELYRSRNLRADIAKSRAEVQKGKTYTLDEIEKRLGFR